MNIYLLGNGFDLHYCFPTRYIDFLYTIRFLANHRETCFYTVGQVFESPELQTNDDIIKTAFQLYSECYYNTLIDSDMTSEFIKLVCKNLWFSYMEKRAKVSDGWIDFEKEIVRVIDWVSVLLSSVQKFHQSYILDPTIMRDEEAKEIVDNFGFFCEEKSQYGKYGLNVSHFEIKNEYLVSAFANSQKKHVDSKRIVDELFNGLMDFASLLAFYLLWFVDKPLNTIQNSKVYTNDNFLEDFRADNDSVITFNYTHTWERLIMKSITGDLVVHIHGSIGYDTGNFINSEKTIIKNHRLVLGVNSDKHDELKDIDTTFIRFKKYHQRAVFSTEEAYYKLLSEIKESKNEEHVQVIVVGHSLDITDKDIIQDVFMHSTQITVFYYSERQKRSLIHNLIIMYGKSGFDRLRKENNLCFKKISTIRVNNKP